MKECCETLYKQKKFRCDSTRYRLKFYSTQNPSQRMSWIMLVKSWD